MSGFGLLMIAIVALPLLWAVGAAMSATSVQKKFADLGTLTGKTKAEILAVVGQPNSVSSVGDGKTLLQWQATGYHIALMFTGEICDGVTHEHSA